MDYLVAIISGIGGAVLGGVGTWLTLRFNYRELFAKTVSNRRVEWIRLLPENIGVLLSETERNMRRKGDKKTKSPSESKSDYYISRTIVLTIINLKECLHCKLHNLILRLDDYYHKEPPDQDLVAFCELRGEIIEITRKIEKAEWEHVKSEARKGKIR
ncbi:MAG: hypothetical protein LBM78_04045 [Clostridiales bacterium]|nr:hypothetical protein [Clostridiales bacterium]